MTTTEEILEFAMAEVKLWHEKKDENNSNVGRLDANLRLIKQFGDKINREKVEQFKKEMPEYF